MTCDFQQCGILTRVDSGEPLQLPVKLRNSKYCSVSSLTVIEYSSDLVGFVALRPKSTAMVIAGRSVHLTTFFPGQA